MPQDKRYDLSLPIPSDAEEDTILPIDKEPQSGPQPTKYLRDLIQDVPHLDFAAALQHFPAETHELLTGIDSPAADSSTHQTPPTFLTADDIDNYLWEVDNQIARDPDIFGGHTELLPTLAPLAREQQSGRGATPLLNALKGGAAAAGASSVSTASRDFALRNPTSVYNWLRKHAPKTFLQDHEGGDDKKDKAGEKSHHRKTARGDDEDEEDEKRPSARKGAGGGARKSSGGDGRASISVARAKATKTDRPSKRASAAQAKEKRKSFDALMVDVEDEAGTGEAAPSASKAKRKRPADDDTGYRPKGGSSRRPPKKRSKNNSIGGSSAVGPLAGIAGGDEKVETEEVVGKKDAGKIQDEVQAAPARLD